MGTARLAQVHPKMVICTECAQERYCSEQCRDQSWVEYHRALCPGTERVGEPLQPTLVVGLTCKMISRLIIQFLSGKLSLHLSTREAHSLLDAADERLKTKLDWSFHHETVRGLFRGGDWSLLSLFPTSSSGYLIHSTDHRAPHRWYFDVFETFNQSFEPLLVHSLRNIFLHPVMVRYLYGLASRNFRDLYLGEDPAGRSRTIWSLMPHYHIIPRMGTFFSHSCMPNLQLSVSPQKKIVYSALRTILPNEALTVSFLHKNLDASLSARRQTLQTNYGFWCRCQRCQMEALKAKSKSSASISQS